jgi:CDP-diacylglycerol---glycerol-3-phosphate 3-phosphatidyltransferase
MARPFEALAPMNLPNALTVARIFLVPLLVVVLLTKFPAPEILGLPKEVVAAGIFALAALTDWLDGYLARRRQQITMLGQLLDPLADKLLVTAALVSLVQMELAPAWMVAIILGREIWVTALRSLAQARGITIPASNLGKIKMVGQVVAILALLLGREWLPWATALGHAALWVVLLVAVVSAVDYYKRFSSLTNPSARG